ncbi:DNA adenine methylase, partial [Acinetobacter baumannii]
MDRAKNKLVAPVVKWVGGKRQLLDEITPLLPKRLTSYCEPF